jgi:Type IV secretion-system coupling protein DNA-binding domain/TraM recognition site of TraD and TraG
MSRLRTSFEPESPLAPIAQLAHWPTTLALHLLFGLAAGALVARLMRAKGVHWGWAAVATPAIYLLRAELPGLSSALLVTALTATWHARRWHRSDLDAGADLAEAAARRDSPGESLTAAARALAARHRRFARSAWTRDGELILGVDERGRAVPIPFGGARGGTHTLLVGATGSGKTVTQAAMTTRAIERGMGAIVLDPKGDTAMRAALAASACRAQRPFIEWTPEGPSSYNPFARGSDTEIADKALAGERFTEPHYLRQAQRYLGHVVRALRAAGVEIGLHQIVRHLDPAELELLARDLPEELAERSHAYLDSLTTRQLTDLAGVRDRLSILAESDVGRWLMPQREGAAAFDLLAAAEQRAVVYFRLDADRRPLLAQMLAAAIVQDLQTVVSSLQAKPTRAVVVIDEFSALAAEHVVRLFGRARSAGVSLILSTQELSDLRLSGRDALLEQVLGNLSVLLAHRQVVAASAELIGGLAGPRGTWRTSHSSDGRITRTRTRESVLRAEHVTALGTGLVAAIVLSGGVRARIAWVTPPAREQL